MLPVFIYHQFPITHVPQVSIFPNRNSWKLAPTLYHYAGHTQGLSPVLLYVWWCTTVIGILRITFKFQQVLTYLITFSWLKQTYLFSQTWDSDNGRVARKICSNNNGFKLFHENSANFSRLVVNLSSSLDRAFISYQICWQEHCIATVRFQTYLWLNPPFCSASLSIQPLVGMGYLEKCQNCKPRHFY